jgi:hypothetical protein
MTEVLIIVFCLIWIAIITSTSGNGWFHNKNKYYHEMTKDKIARKELLNFLWSHKKTATIKTKDKVYKITRVGCGDDETH